MEQRECVRSFLIKFFPSQSLIITAFSYLLSLNLTGVTSVLCQGCTQLGEGSEDMVSEEDGWWWLLQLVLLPGQLLGWLLYPSVIYIIPSIPLVLWNLGQGEQ